MEIDKIINLLHWCLIIYNVSAIFINNYQHKKNALILLIFIFIQFMVNQGKCGLTELEYLVKREKYKDGFFYRLIKPVITLPESYFNDLYYIIHLSLILILIYQLKFIQK
jgi:hypothetical protein